MAIDITALYCCLDDFCKVFEDWEAHQLIPSPTTRQRSGKLSRSEMLFIVVLFHLAPYKISRRSTSTASVISIAPALAICRMMTASSARCRGCSCP
jgi:hypothetical protein